MPWNIGLKLERDGTYSCVLTYVGDGTPEDFVIPDGVERIRIECWGADGGQLPTTPGANVAQGAYVAASFNVVGGETYTVYPATQPSGVANALCAGGWPNGGDGGQDANEDYMGTGGGGSSSVRPQGGTFADSLIVAGGGGGMAGIGSGPPRYGGNAGYPDGADGDVGYGTGATGATQFAGGSGGDTAPGGPYQDCFVFNPPQDGTAGTFGQGGEGAGGQVCDLPGPGGWEGGGGGGGGWYGGGGGGGAAITSAEADGGGGGSSWVDPAGYDIDSGLSGHAYGDGRIVVTFCDVPPES